MTLEELKAVKAAWEQREILAIILAALGVGAITLLGSYLKEKGKNRALKEDLAQLTRKVESIKSEIASKEHFSRYRYELEVGLYKDFWKKLHPVYEAALFFQLSHDMQARAETLGKANREFFDSIRDNIPFYPREIWEQLRAFSDTCTSLASAQSMVMGVRNEGASNELQGRIGTLQAKAREQVEGIESAIRQRVRKFDFPQAD
jgi:hypothetical protein